MDCPVIYGPGTQHGLVGPSVVGVGQHVDDGVGHARDEQADVGHDRHDLYVREETWCLCVRVRVYRNVNLQSPHLVIVVEVVDVADAGAADAPSRVRNKFKIAIGRGAIKVEALIPHSLCDVVGHRDEAADGHAAEDQGHHAGEALLN